MSSFSRHDRFLGRGFTLTELLVVMAIVALLVALLFPTIQNTLAGAAEAKCAANMRQLGIAIAGYAGEHDGWIVPWRASKSADDYWVALLSPYLNYDYQHAGGWPADANSAFMCPVKKANKKGATEDVLSLSAQVKAKFRYGINIQIAEDAPDGASIGGSSYRKVHLNQVKASKTYIVMDHFGAGQAGAQCATDGSLTWPHRGHINALFLDGHTEPVSQDRMDYLGQNIYHVFWRGYDWGKGGYSEN